MKSGSYHDEDGTGVDFNLQFYSYDKQTNGNQIELRMKQNNAPLRIFISSVSQVNQHFFSRAGD